MRILYIYLVTFFCVLSCLNCLLLLLLLLLLLSLRFFKKNEGDIVIASVRLSVRPSVCPLCYLLLNHWTKFNQIWCESYSHEWGVQRQIFFWPRGRSQKVKYHLISITKSISKIFYTKLCVCSHK